MEDASRVNLADDRALTVQNVRLPVTDPGVAVNVVVSRTHMSGETDVFIEEWLIFSQAVN
ncbi:hypothetical protein GMD78_03420 [Ornithinibacillus sp. L9]|uniref:Uncharacterized protein n=1 Tax=Ornithinibacillus caprae TaxID=2678566 RepID=A0A6N8FI71_9BACI|nr:hypothetical protein [Ornithinibacillus caprae]MUK87449.1 hypothetical protein [Ornithinibacillus caprae]